MCNCGSCASCCRYGVRPSFAERTRQKYPINEVDPRHLDEAVRKYLPMGAVEEFYKLLHDLQNPPRVYSAEYIYTHQDEFIGRKVETHDGWIKGVVTDIQHVELNSEQNYVFVIGGKARFFPSMRMFVFTKDS